MWLALELDAGNWRWRGFGTESRRGGRLNNSRVDDPNEGGIGRRDNQNWAVGQPPPPGERVLQLQYLFIVIELLSHFWAGAASFKLNLFGHGCR